MIKSLKEKWEDIYSYFDHLWWKYKIDIICILIFLIGCLINILSYK